MIVTFFYFYMCLYVLSCNDIYAICPGGYGPTGGFALANKYALVGGYGPQ